MALAARGGRLSPLFVDRRLHRRQPECVPAGEAQLLLPRQRVEVAGADVSPTDIVDQVESKVAFQASVAVVRSTNRMMGDVLDLLA